MTLHRGSNNCSTEKMMSNKIKIKIFNYFVNALIDTGCSTSVTSEQLINKLRIPIQRLEKGDPRFLFGANNSRITIVGKALISIKLNGLTVPFDFLIAKDLSHDILLGNDFLQDTRALIDYSDSSVTFFDNLVEMKLLNKHHPTVACLDIACTLLPRTETIVPVKLSKKLHGENFLIEPLPLRENQKYLVAKILTKVSDGKTLCHILNATNQDIYLRRKLPLASASLIDSHSISNVDINSVKTRSNVNTVSEEANASSNPNSCDTQPQNFVQGVHRKLEELGIKIDNKNLSAIQKQKLSELIEKNSDIFALNLKDLPGTDIIRYDIDTGDHPPVRARAYRPTPSGRIEITRQIKELLDADFIAPSTSIWSSPTILVRKKGGEQRFVVDYRALNRISKAISYPIPILSDVIDTLAYHKSAYFTLLDMKSGYHQIKMTKNASMKSAFCVPEGSFEWKRLSFGLQGAGVAFGLLMSEVLRGLTFQKLVVYVDDILVFSPSFDQHCKDLEEVFQRLRLANLRLHAKKCSFSKSEVLYLGHIISSEGTRIDPSKISIIRQWPTPTCVKHVRQICGYANFYRKYAYQFSQIIAPLNNLLKKDQPFVWSKECQEAFDKLKDILSTTPLLRYPDVNRPFIITTDASLNGIAFILSQKDANGVEKPISFGGRSLRPNEKNWGVSDQECLAVIEAIRENYAYLQNQTFDIITDHISLKYLNSLRNSQTGRLFRWALQLEHLRYNVIHRPGKQNINADILSRIDKGEPPPEDPESEFLDENMQIVSLDDSPTTNDVLSLDEPEFDEHCLKSREVSEPAIAYLSHKHRTHGNTLNVVTEEDIIIPTDDIKTLQENCSDVSRILLYLKSGEIPENEKLARKTIFESDSYFLENDILFHRYQRKSKIKKSFDYPMTEQLVLPQSLRLEVIRKYHEQGHKNFTRTYLSLRERYYWSGMYQEIKTKVRSCNFCQRVNIATHPKRAPLKPWKVEGVWKKIHIDLIGTLPEDSNHNRWALLVIDSFSHWLEVFPLSTIESSAIADILFNECISRFGIFQCLVSDRGTSFTSKIVERLCDLCHIRRAKAMPYHQASNGAVEVINKFIWKNLQNYCQKDHRSWATYLPSIACAHRGTVSVSSTQFSPHHVFTGRHMFLPIDDMIQFRPTEGGGDVGNYMRTLEENIKIIHKIATENMIASQAIYKKQYDKKATPCEYPVGKVLWMYSPNQMKAGTSKKLHIPFNHLVRIHEKLGEVSYTVADAKTGIILKYPVHVDNLREYIADKLNPTDLPSDQIVAKPLDEPSKTPDVGIKDATNSNTSIKTIPIDLTKNDTFDTTHSPRVELKIPSVPDTQSQNTGTDQHSDSAHTHPLIDVSTRKWHAVDKLTMSKFIDGKQHYLVQWRDQKLPSTWELGTNISDKLKNDFTTNFFDSGRAKRKITRQ